MPARIAGYAFAGGRGENMKTLKELLKEADKLFPKSKKPKLCSYNYILGKFPYGWVFNVTTNWYNWGRNNLKHQFGAYNEPEYAVQAFLDYVKKHKINVMKLAKDSPQ